MRWLRQMSALLIKDLRIEWRSKDVLTAMLMFALIVITVMTVAFEPGCGELNTIIPGVIWITLLFAGNLGLNRSFAREMENGALDGLRVCAVARSAIYVAKFASQVILMMLTAAIVWPIMVLFFDLGSLAHPLLFILILLLGSTGFSAAGTLLATMAIKTRTRDMMLPILLFPITVPVILAAVKGTALTLYSESIDAVFSWLHILIAFDVIMITACVILYDYVIDD